MTMADIPLWADLLASLLLVSGGVLTLIGSFGLLRLPDLFARCMAPTMGNTLGLGCVLLASILVASVLAHRFVFQEVLIALFVVATSARDRDAAHAGRNIPQARGWRQKSHAPAGCGSRIELKSEKEEEDGYQDNLCATGRRV